MLTRASSVFIHHHIFSLNHLLSIIAMWRLALLDNKELVEVYSSLYVMLFWIKDWGGDMDMLKRFLWYNQRYDRFDYKFFELKRKWCRRCENLLTISHVIPALWLKCLRRHFIPFTAFLFYYICIFVSLYPFFPVILVSL